MAQAKLVISADDQASQALQKISAETTQLGNSTEGAAKKMSTINRALSSAKKEAMSLTAQWRALDDTVKNSDYGRNLKAQLDQVLQKAGELQDIKGDVANEIKNIASDTKMWDGAKQGIGILSSSIQGLASVVGMCGGNVEAFTKALNIMKGVEAATNTIIGIGNALQKNSALMVALRALKTNLFTAAETRATAATTAHTAATEAQTVAQAANNAVAMANPYVAIAAAIIGVATAIWGAVKATDEETESLQNNSDASNTNLQWKERLKKSEEDWSKSVTQAAQSQIQKYTELQLKWLECNKDQKLREKFQKEYGDEVNRVAGKVKKLSEYEDFFVRDTDKVVNAILARAAAEAGAQKYAEAILKKAENDRNGTVANGRYYRNAHAGTAFSDLSPEEQAYLKRVGGANASQNPYLQYHAGWSSYWTINEAGAKQVEQFRQNVARGIRAQDDAEIDFWKNWASEQSRKAAEAEKAAGMGVGGGGSNYHPPKAFSGGGGSHGGSSGSHGSSGSGTEKKPEQEVKPLAQSLEWMRQQLSELQKQLSYGLIPSDKIEETKSKIEYLKKSIEKKEIELGFKTEPVKGTLDWFQEELSKRNKRLNSELLSEDDAKKIQEEIEDLTKQEYEAKIKLGIELPPRTDFERLTIAEKYKNDWKDLTKYISDYAAKAEEYAANLKKYEDDMKAYNDAWTEYNNNIAKYGEQEKQFAKYNELLKKREELEKKYENGQIGDDKYEKELQKLDEQIDKISNKLWPAVEGVNNELDDFQNKIADLNEQLRNGLITAEQFEVEFEKLCSSGNELSNVMVRGFSKPIKPKIELPKKPFNPLQSASLEEIFPSLDKIPEHISQLMQAVDEKLSQDDLNVFVRAELNTTRDKLQQMLNDIVQGELSIKAIIEPSFIMKGSDDDKRASYSNAQAAAQRFQNDYSIGLISYDKFKEELDKINAELESLKLKPIDLQIKSPLFEQLDNAANVLNQFGDAVSKLGEATDNLALKAAATIAQAIANIWLGYSQASVQSAKLGPWAWLGFSAGALAQVIGVITAIKSSGSFAEGGIIKGSTTIGDRVLIRANAGEMVLNNRQQKRLFDLIDHGNVYGDGISTSTVRVKGSDLYLALKNYQKIKGKSGITTGIQ